VVAKLACGATLSATREFAWLAWVVNLLVVAVMITTRELLAPFVATPFISRDNYPTNLCYSPYMVTQKSAKCCANLKFSVALELCQRMEAWLNRLFTYAPSKISAESPLEEPMHTHRKGHYE